MLLTDKNFDEIIEQHEIILVDFWAEWCGPCRMLSPILDELSQELDLPVGKLNVDENLEKRAEYSVQSIPTMVLFVSGKPVKTINGAKPKHSLLKELSEWI
jgi:thioredoxin 1